MTDDDGRKIMSKRKSAPGRDVAAPGGPVGGGQGEALNPSQAVLERADPGLLALPTFERLLYARLRKGGADYGGRSFSADPLELLRELQDETLDIAGWGFILWTRLDRMKKAIANMEAENEDCKSD